MLPIPKFKQVYVNISAGTIAGSQVALPLVEELRNKKVVAIEFYDATLLSNTQDQVAVITAADGVKAEAVLKEDSNERVQAIPLQTLNPVNVAGIYKQFEPFVINWQASFIRFNAVPAGLPCSVPLGIMYEE